VASVYPVEIQLTQTLAGGSPVTGLTWDSFQRTYSSWSHEKGVPGKVTGQQMGLANVDTTLNVYTQVLDGSVQEAVEKVGGELFTIVHKPSLDRLGTP
jgi:integrase